MTTPNYRKASIYFDDETVLEVEQRGGGGSGVGGDTGLSAVNLITGESTNDALAEKDETIEEQAGTIEQQEATIETQAGTISDLEDEVAAKQAIIDAFPTIEALSVTANGTYSEAGKAYSPVNVNVAESDDLIAYTIKLTIQNANNKRILYESGGHQSQMYVRDTNEFSILTYITRKNSQTDTAFIDLLTDATSRTSNLISGASASLIPDSSINSVFPGWQKIRLALTAGVTLDKIRVTDIGSITLS